ncbi:MAG: cache domain-containing protein, partial [Pseudomonadota bacterium]
MTSPARWLKGPLAAFGLAIAVLGANYLAYPMLEERLVLASQDSSTSTLGLVTDAMDQASERYEPLPRLIASDPILRQLINEPGNQGVVPFVNEKLRQLTDTLEVSDIYVIGPAGRVLAASNYRQTRSLMAVDLSHRPYVARALQGEPAHFHARVGQTRSFTFAAPILDGIEVRGVLAVQVNVEALEASWESGPHDILVADQNGIVFLSSREDYLLRSLAPLSDGVRARIEAARQLPMAELDQIPFAAGLIAESAVEVVLGEGEDAQSFLANSSPLSLTGWHAIVLVPLRPIRQQALYALAVGNLAAAALALIALVIYQRRARVLERMRVQESQQALLEQMVEERTADLDHANATLRGEVSERKAAEERLRRTQKDLVQAGKLAALGQMSAAISHEI